MGEEFSLKGKIDATGVQPWKPSEELQTLLAGLSRQQARAVMRIAEAELLGETRESLLHGPNKVCNRSTFYRPRGWIHKAMFRAALELAEREVRALRMGGVIEEALAELKETTPLAARDLRRQIAGDENAIDALAAVLRDRTRKVEERTAAIEGLGLIGTKQATSALMEAMSDGRPEIRLRVIEALGAAAAGVNPARRLASIAVLDRADDLTASKGGPTDAEIDAEIERRLAKPSGDGNT